jgi:hypothetical protein
MKSSRVKHISEVDVDIDTIAIRQPFSLERDRQRRYIRLEISEPIEYALIKGRTGRFYLADQAPCYRGAILNLSAGGALIVSPDPIEEDSLVLAKITLQEVEIVDHVIGLVKRAEADGKEWLIGLEFISRDQLNDYLSEAEIEMLPENAASFDDRIRQTLNKYIYSHRVKREKVS